MSSIFKNAAERSRRGVFPLSPVLVRWKIDEDLIVEDHQRMRRLIRPVVGELAQAVAECADCAEAVAAYAAQQFNSADWVLMDLEMPGIDGLEATRRLRAAFPDATIIVVTQYGDEHLRAAASDAGACGYILKENLLELRQLIPT